MSAPAVAVPLGITRPPECDPIPFAKAPRRLDALAGYKPRDHQIWYLINTSTQIATRKGEISVPGLAHYAECTERTVYRSLRRLKDGGAIYALTLPGKTSVYYLPFQYMGPKSAPAPTPDKEVARGAPPTPDKEVKAHIRNARAASKEAENSAEKRENTRAFSEGVTSRTEPQTVNNPEKPDPEKPEAAKTKSELLTELRQRHVAIKPHKQLLARATVQQLEQAIADGDKRALGPGLYIHILRDNMGIPTKPPVPAPSMTYGSLFADMHEHFDRTLGSLRRASGLESAAGVAQRAVRKDWYSSEEFNAWQRQYER